mgnify:CR=1 FL=1
MSKIQRKRRDIRPEERWTPRQRNAEHTPYTISVCRKYDEYGHLWRAAHKNTEVWRQHGKRLAIWSVVLLLLVTVLSYLAQPGWIGVMLVATVAILGMLWRRTYRFRKKQEDEVRAREEKLGVEIQQLGLTRVYDSSSWYEEVEEYSAEPSCPMNNTSGKERPATDEPRELSM